MKKDFLDKQKKKLTAERNEILDSLTGRNDQLTSLGGATESADDADIAKELADFKPNLNGLRTAKRGDYLQSYDGPRPTLCVIDGFRAVCSGVVQSRFVEAIPRVASFAPRQHQRQRLQSPPSYPS